MDTVHMSIHELIDEYSLEEQVNILRTCLKDIVKDRRKEYKRDWKKDRYHSDEVFRRACIDSVKACQQGKDAVRHCAEQEAA